MFDMPPLPKGITTLINAESERLDRKYPDLPADPRQCLTCGGAECFRWWDRYVPDRDPANPDVVVYNCPCVDQWILNRYLLYHGIEVFYQRLGWDDLTDAEPAAVEAVQGYLADLDRNKQAGIGFILHGGIGTGKSLLATLIAKHALAEGYDAHFTTFSGMLAALTAGWTDADDRDWFAKRIRNAGILVLDDIGREHKQRNYSKSEGRLMDNTMALSESSVDELLRHRVAAAKPTILTTNLDIDMLEAHYGSNVMSLLKECSASYRFQGNDFRPRARDRRLDEVEAGLTRPVVTA